LDPLRQRRRKFTVMHNINDAATVPTSLLALADQVIE
jgi:hypothetical protein